MLAAELVILTYARYCKLQKNFD